MIPDAAAGAVFLGAVDTLRGVGWVALSAALAVASAMSLRLPDRVRLRVVLVTIGATTLAVSCQVLRRLLARSVP